jgi:integrase
MDLEKESERKVHQTKQTYGVYLKTRIVLPWGGQPFREIKAVTVERWLGSIDDLSNGTKAKIKGVMGEVFQHAIRYGWLNDGENPIFAVRQSTNRMRVTEPLEAAEFRALILELPHKMRVIGIVAATTGLRISEVLGLKWKDIDWKALQMEVTRSVVDGIVGKCKTETSVDRCQLMSSPPRNCQHGNGKPLRVPPYRCPASVMETRAGSVNSDRGISGSSARAQP